MHQMGLAQADAAIQEQWVESRAGGLVGDPAGAGMGELVRLAHHKAVEAIARIKRSREVITRMERLDHTGRGARPRLAHRAWCGPGLGRLFGEALRQAILGRRPAEPHIHAAHHRILGLPEQVQSGAIMAAHPIPQEMVWADRRVISSPSNPPSVI